MRWKSRVMGELVQLFPKRRVLGTYVTSLGNGWVVMNIADVPISRHDKVETACRMCVWHSGTRFVYVKGDMDRCWDSFDKRFVSFDDAVQLMGQATNQANH